jgi:hypothetical protein
MFEQPGIDADIQTPVAWQPDNHPHPDMKRYFMTIPEAVHLVLQASSPGRRKVFVINGRTGAYRRPG